LYQIQISATNILGTNEFANPAPVTNTTILDTDSMTVVAPNVVYSRIGTLPEKVSMSSIIPTVIPDSGGKKVKLSWLVPTPYAYVPYAYAIKYTLLTDVSGVLVPPPANIPDASWNVISPSSFIVSYDEIRTAAEAGANTAVMTVISGLTNGQRYSFRVAALNAAGRGAYSDAIPTPIIPGSVPSVLNVLTEMAYTINTSTGGVIALYWISPNKNGYAVTTYRVRRRLNLQGDADWVTTEIAVPPGVTDTQPYRTLTTTGLVNGAIYEYQVAARNQLGWSEFSETLYAVPRKVPDPVSNVSASILNQGLKISWDTGGVNDGGYPITGYRVQYLPVTVSTPSDAWRSIDVDGIYSSTVEINGLVNGITHRIRVLQFNAIGSSVPELSGFIEAVPGVVSLPPTGLFITVGNTRVTVFWTAPTSTGTNDVSYYVVQYKPASDSDNLYEYVKNPGQTTPKQFTNENVSLVPNAPGYDAFFAVVEGLMNGTNYNVRVATVTQVGIGQWSLPLEGIPGTVPSKVM
jgi:titin